jgi:hypothetical protein
MLCTVWCGESDWCLMPMQLHSNFSAISWQEQVNFQWDDGSLMCRWIHT